jgi:hypothetical protein
MTPSLIGRCLERPSNIFAILPWRFRIRVRLHHPQNEEGGGVEEKKIDNLPASAVPTRWVIYGSIRRQPILAFAHSSTTVQVSFRAQAKVQGTVVRDLTPLPLHLRCSSPWRTKVHACGRCNCHRSICSPQFIPSDCGSFSAQQHRMSLSSLARGQTCRWREA